MLVKPYKGEQRLYSDSFKSVSQLKSSTSFYFIIIYSILKDRI